MRCDPFVFQSNKAEFEVVVHLSCIVLRRSNLMPRRVDKKMRKNHARCYIPSDSISQISRRNILLQHLRARCESTFTGVNHPCPVHVIGVQSSVAERSSPSRRCAWIDYGRRNDARAARPFTVDTDWALRCVVMCSTVYDTFHCRPRHLSLTTPWLRTGYSLDYK